MSSRGEVLVAIMNNLLDFAIARDHHWYRIPVRSVDNLLKERWPPQWLAFYQTKVFSDEGHAVNYYARVLDIREVFRWQLFPDEPQDRKAQRRYCQLILSPLTRSVSRLTTCGTTTWKRPAGWRVLRFNTHHVQEAMAEYCLPTIVKNINRLGGLDEGRIVPRKIDLETPGGLQQMTLFDLVDQTAEDPQHGDSDAQSD